MPAPCSPSSDNHTCQSLAPPHPACSPSPIPRLPPAGMTLKFFALFFIQAVGLSPMAVSLVGALSPLGVSAAALACQPLSKPLGRVQIRWGHEGRGLVSAAAGLNGLRQCWQHLCLNGVPCPCKLPPACTALKGTALGLAPACKPTSPAAYPPRPPLQPDHSLPGHPAARPAGLPAHLPALRAAPAGGGAPGPHGGGKCNAAAHALRWMAPGRCWRAAAVSCSIAC